MRPQKTVPRGVAPPSPHLPKTRRLVKSTRQRVVKLQPEFKAMPSLFSEQISAIHIAYVWFEVVVMMVFKCSTAPATNPSPKGWLMTPATGLPSVVRNRPISTVTQHSPDTADWLPLAPPRIYSAVESTSDGKELKES